VTNPALGVPFPAGTFKVYQKDAAVDGLTFLGEDEIGHTTKDETVRLCIGEAFDIHCERKCVSKQNDQDFLKEQWQIYL
jgi:hypothetical protein